jgi:hypothetical protein
MTQSLAVRFVEIFQLIFRLCSEWMTADRRD